MTEEEKGNGLYRPETEHDACGVGIVADILGRRSHAMIEMGLEVLDNLAHRGACGCDPMTGDGGGVLLQLPHAFFKERAADIGIPLPEPGRYGVAMVFLPWEAEDRAACQSIIEETVKEEGQSFLGWRDVPVDDSGIGVIAQDSEPVIRQAFVGRRPSLADQDAFERKLFVIRKVVERKVAQSGLKGKVDFYIPSCSSNTIVYKGLLMPEQVRGYFLDLSDPLVDSSFVLVHSRFSTNTLGSWRLAHPYRYIAHNGEINTLRGNINWMTAREMVMSSPLFGEDIKKLIPVLTPGASDTATIDNAFELLALSGRELPHVMAMLIPEAWEGAADISPERRAFYEYHSFLMEPWDGPALIAFTDGKRIGANLDRNGLRPFRYTVTKDNLIVMASEAGVLSIPPGRVLYKGRLRPGRMMLIDPEEGRVLDDEEIKSELASRQPYGQWLADNIVRVDSLASATDKVQPGDSKTLLPRQQAFGYTLEELRMILQPMLESGGEATGSMGTDTPLAVLSDRPQLVFNYFKQLFAQVTNPPLDAIREELVTSLEAPLGAERNLLAETLEHARQLRLSHPVLSDEELERIRHVDEKGIRAITLKALLRVNDPRGLEHALEELCAQAAQAVRDGYSVIILSDRGVDADHAPIPSLLACSGVHHHLIRLGLRTRAGLVVESGEPREVMHFSLLIGYGAGAVNPYLVFETIKDMEQQGLLGVDAKTAQKNFTKAIEKGILKVASKMGISTIQGYRGAQIFEAVGLNAAIIDRFFTWTPSRISGVGIEVIEEEARQRHTRGFGAPQTPAALELEIGGLYQWRRGGEYHMYNPETIARLQIAARTNNYKLYREFAALIDGEEQQLCTLRGLLDFSWSEAPIPLEEVEPAAEIVRRFATGAISLGAISREAHETLAIATNRMGARSNTGEGGEDYRRFTPDPNGDSRSSAVKQVASGRFGVTTNYLVNARDLQIKMAQGSKPGEGGQLPGHKISEYIGWVRRTTPGVELISPPPHHDIYSIEDLAQLIHDLKNVNPEARIHVKLVSEVGVGTIAAGVSKGHGDVVLISGDSGGTGASPESSIKYAGLPWELGLAETQQVLVRNDLRGRIVVQTDGQLKTGRDVAIACLLGAEEFGFSTAPLVTLGCIMLRKCHLNACSVGIATQDPELRKQFAGKPEYVINYFFMLAEHLREIMAKLGLRTVNEMVGRVDLLDSRKAIDHWKAKGLDFSNLLYQSPESDKVARYCIQKQDHGLEKALDHTLIEIAQATLDGNGPVEATMPIRNSNRTVGAMLSGKVARQYGEKGLPDDSIQFHFTGSAGLSFGAFLARGVSFTLEGEANDYMGKGMSGGRIVVYPPQGSTFVPEDNTIIGNVALYGATGGMAFLRGMGGERFAVRNSGAHAVVEGVGDHGCEYMTGGMVVVLGGTGRNFAAGMSGGVAYVLDEDGHFVDRCNTGMVDLEAVEEPEDQLALRQMIEWHVRYTRSDRGQKILDQWRALLPKFVKVMPRDYRRVLTSHNQKLPKEVELLLNGRTHQLIPAPVV
ncbi:MAG: glutamate synthase large subunit [Chloroflexi bacterium]|nr:glutamate synthase large subunit [Chloroflexota bacterium]